MAVVPPRRPAVLYFELNVGKPSEVRVGSLDSPETKSVLPLFSRALYAETGHLLFVREGTLMAQAFSLDTFSTSGSAMPVAEDLLSLPGSRRVRFLGLEERRSGVSGPRHAIAAGLVPAERYEMTQLGAPGDYWFPRLSRDETKVASDVMNRRAGTTDIQIFDLVRGGPASSVTLDPTIDWTPVLSPDGQQVASHRRAAACPTSTSRS